jgi:hypothetical protein
LWPFLTLESQARVESLLHLPDWLRQTLLELDAASETKTVVAILKQLHRDLYAQVHLVPLWEIDQFIVLRKNIGNFPVRPVAAYQNVEQWVVQPWFPSDPP